MCALNAVFASLNITLVTKNLLSRNLYHDIAPCRYAFQASSSSKRTIYKVWCASSRSLSHNELVKYPPAAC